jgi:hypothetical protein
MQPRIPAGPAPGFTGAGATNDTIKNCNISTGTNAATSYGIYVGSTTIGTAGDDNDNLTIQNNNIFRAYYGIRADANATGLNNNLTITGNSIGSNTVGSEILFRGVTLSQATGASISGNTIFNLQMGTTSGDPVAIELATGAVSSTIAGNLITEINGTAMHKATHWCPHRQAVYEWVLRTASRCLPLP